MVEPCSASVGALKTTTMMPTTCFVAEYCTGYVRELARRCVRSSTMYRYLSDRLRFNVSIPGRD
jgi:hypothetical protein